MSHQKRLLTFGGSLATAFLLMTAGCHSSGGDGGSSAPPSPAPPATNKAQSIQQIEANPNIPPQQKAAIISQMQGQSPPSTQAGTPAPK